MPAYCRTLVPLTVLTMPTAALEPTKACPNAVFVWVHERCIAWLWWRVMPYSLCPPCLEWERTDCCAAFHRFPCFSLFMSILNPLTIHTQPARTMTSSLSTRGLYTLSCSSAARRHVGLLRCSRWRLQQREVHRLAVAAAATRARMWWSWQRKHSAVWTARWPCRSGCGC